MNERFVGRQTKEWSDEHTEEREKTTGVNGENEREREIKKKRERVFRQLGSPNASHDL